jgi:hypothetical protein
MRKVCVVLIALLVAALPAAPQVQAQDKATEVLAKMRDAIGGGKLDSLKTFSLIGKSARNMTNGQMVSEVEMYLELPDKYLRVENLTAPIARTIQSGHNGDKPILPQGMNAGGAGAPMVIMNGAPAGGGGGGMRMTMEVAVAGGGGTRDGGPGGAANNTNVTPEMRNAQMIRAQRIDLSRMMLGWFGMAHPGLNATYTYGGEAESPDGKAHIVNVKADGGFEVKLFIDQATNMPLMVSWMALEPIRLTNMGPGRGAAPGAPVVAGGAPAGGQTQMTPEEMQKEMQRRLEEARKNAKMIEYRVYFGDWKEVNGIQFPHTLQRATGAETTEELTITKVQVNPKIDAKKFQ